MKALKIVLGTSLTAGIILLLGGVFASSLLPEIALAHGPWGEGRGPAPMDPVERCERMDPEHLKYAGAFASAFLDLTADQRDALEPVLDAMRSWATEAKSLCPSLASVAVEDRLTTLQAFLSISEDALGDVKAAYAQFEPSLSDAQRTKLEEALAKGPHGRGRRHRW